MKKAFLLAQAVIAIIVCTNTIQGTSFSLEDKATLQERFDRTLANYAQGTISKDDAVLASARILLQFNCHSDVEKSTAIINRLQQAQLLTEIPLAKINNNETLLYHLCPTKPNGASLAILQKLFQTLDNKAAAYIQAPLGNSKNDTALTLAARYQDIDLLTLLFSNLRPTELLSVINKQDQDGNTLAHLACYSLEMVSFLCNMNDDRLFFIANKAGKTAYQEVQESPINIISYEDKRSIDHKKETLALLNNDMQEHLIAIFKKARADALSADWFNKVLPLVASGQRNIPHFAFLFLGMVSKGENQQCRLFHTIFADNNLATKLSASIATIRQQVLDLYRSLDAWEKAYLLKQRIWPDGKTVLQELANDPTKTPIIEQLVQGIGATRKANLLTVQEDIADGNSVLHKAVETGNVTLVRLIISGLQEPANLLRKNFAGKTARALAEEKLQTAQTDEKRQTYQLIVDLIDDEIHYNKAKITEIAHALWNCLPGLIAVASLTLDGSTSPRTAALMRLGTMSISSALQFAFTPVLFKESRTLISKTTSIGSYVATGTIAAIQALKLMRTFKRV